MEHCRGGDLEQLLEAQNAFTEVETACIINEVLKVVAACHSKQIVHGDIKPANFLLKEPQALSKGLVERLAQAETCWLRAVDFGCSQPASQGEPLSRRTGTPVFMAPEVFKRHYGLQADMWSVGMMFYHLMTRRFPFWESMDSCRSSTLDEVMRAVTTEQTLVPGRLITAPAGFYAGRTSLRAHACPVGALATGEPASLSRLFIGVQPARHLVRQGTKLTKPNGPASLVLILFTLLGAVAAALRQRMVQTVRECATCHGFGIQRCSLCSGSGTVGWEGKWSHKEPCPMCLGKRFVRCPDCGGSYHRPIFNHSQQGALSLHDLSPLGGSARRQK
ncbi:hypothetical protein WJX72_010182 [[Myrmecia] bisecta]|uniref:Protein kinase domain-containing protein n=1 Tax=[Myrmecia] bisecta TaxID=41462 RepID=A0AAW1PZ92_9CHLO